MTPQRHARIRAVLDRRQPDLTLVLEGVHKPHNLSAIQRSCDAAGVFALHAVSPRHRYRPRKGIAAGSAKWVEIHNHQRVEAAIRGLQERGFQVIAAHLDEQARSFRDFDYRLPTAFLMGTEKFGVSPRALALADGRAYIPMHGMVASLNVSVAAATLLYEAERQRDAAGFYATPRLDAELYRHTLFRWGYPILAARHDALGLPYPELDARGGLCGEIAPALRRRLRDAPA